MRIKFTKMSGAGNDFVIVDNRSGLIRDPAGFARRACDRRSGIGADGIILLESSDSAEYRMNYFNADGSYGGMCGNGGRCIAVFAHRAGFVQAAHTFEALGHLYNVAISSGRITLSMMDPRDVQLSRKLTVAGHSLTYHFLDTGSPHVVIDVGEKENGLPTLEQVEVHTLGRLIRTHQAFRPNGTNVNFIEATPDRQLKIRTYERGVEAETLACGTGSVAAAVIARLVNGIDPPVTMIPRSTQKLEVNFKVVGDRVGEVRLTGPAVVTFEGELELEP